jgi:hypothetical protein
VNRLRLLAQTIDVRTGAYGYELVDLPWLPWTSRDAIAGSPAESFVRFWTSGLLPEAPGYIGWVPSIHDAPATDELHQFGFVTAELFVPVSCAADGRRELIEMSCREQRLLSALAACLGCAGISATPVSVSADETNLLLNGAVVGTYRVRVFRAHDWYVSGTALALPNFCRALAATPHTVIEPPATIGGEFPCSSWSLHWQIGTLAPRPVRLRMDAPLKPSTPGNQSSPRRGTERQDPPVPVTGNVPGAERLRSGMSPDCGAEAAMAGTWPRRSGCQ